jgi:deoxyadenosine/deoxycytidine kinase
MGGERYVAIAGPIGVGKTTLAQRLAEHWGWPLLRERFDSNPFLGEYYRGVADVALPNELYFLFSRFEQLRAVPPPGVGAVGPVMSDFIFEKGLLFTARTLSGVQRELFEHLHALLAPLVRKPDAVIYLTDRTDRLLERIRGRGRPMELTLGADYVEPLRAAYEAHFASGPAALRIDCEREDPLAEATLRRIGTYVQQWE